MATMSRRRFGRLVLGGFATSVVSGCAPGIFRAPTSQGPDDGKPAPSPSPAQTTAPAAPPLVQVTTTSVPLPTPNPDSGRPILGNDNVPGFYVRYYKPFQAPDPEKWTLSVSGLVRHPQQLSLADVLGLPPVSQVSRMKCVECWSAAAKWQGFHLSSLVDLVQPEAEAKWVHLYCADDYYESLSIEALLDDRFLFVHHMNDQILPDIYGAPLRLIAPPLYGYKNAKSIVRLEFAEDELIGYWPTVGPYTSSGYVKPGRDHPLDLEGGSREIEGGEIFYPDGIESTQ